MKKIEIALFLVGMVMLTILIKKMNFDLVIGSVTKVGFGFLLIFSQEILAHILNALGWKFSFYPEIASRLKFTNILKTRIAGDGINYLTPSATFAGEWTKAVMIGPDHTIEHRLSSVAIAKIAQGFAMVIFSMAGLLWAMASKIDFKNIKQYIKGGGWLLLAILIIIVMVEIRATKFAKDSKDIPPENKKISVWQKLKKIDATMMEFAKKYPLRFILSITMFILAYFWGSFEVYWICKFLDFPVTIKTAVLIEMLSVFMDGLFFAVPGKAGTQEATKTAIFAALGHDPKIGFAFGLIRHLREIAWAVTGFGLYYQHRKSKKHNYQNLHK